MSYTLAQWKRCLEMLKRWPDMPTEDIRHELNLDSIQCWDIVFDVVTIWKIPRKLKYAKSKRERDYLIEGKYRTHVKGQNKFNCL